MTIPRTLCFITHGSDVLLMKRGEHTRIFPGRYNGIGGHLERDEDPLTGALREITEENRITHNRFTATGNYKCGCRAGGRNYAVHVHGSCFIAGRDRL